MGSADENMAKMQKIEEKVVAIGKKLKKLPDNNDELLALLEEAESVLRIVHQDSPESTQVALLPLMQAFINDKVLKNTDPNIQLQLAVSIHELTRVTAPLQPYPEDLMKECFRLFLVAFKYLHGESEDTYSKAMRIIEKMAEFRSILLLTDFEDCEALIGEIFELFFSAIRSNPSPLMIECMESLMNMVVTYNEEFSMDILKPILASVKMDNKDISPASWELGKRIFEKNPAKLQLWLREADKAMQLIVNDYAEIVFSLLRDTNNAGNTVPEEATSTGDKEIPKPSDQEGNILDDEISQETLNCCEQMMKLKGNTSTSDVEGTNVAQNLKRGMDNEYSRRKRTIKPHSLISPDEGYRHPLSAVEARDADVKILGSRSSKIKRNKNAAPEKKKKLKRSSVDYGEELVGSRVEVWWPKDKTFYTGTVDSYDPSTKKHKIVYDDDEVEVLDMKKEKWEFFNEPHERIPEPDFHQSSPEEPSKDQKIF